ncbi:hypothetical protein HZA42_00155 [Candidatus Peregrinibacteria bacterium]|nr:hypothetical protein [Candidatus Peregrinibacteria bacterium]
MAQTRVLADYVKNAVFAGQEMPEEYADALQEFYEQEAEITKLMSSDWQKCNRRLSVLKLNWLCRRSPAEALSDCQTYLDNKGERLLPYTYDRTTRLSSYGYLVGIGSADSAGAYVSAWLPRSSDPHVGVVFSRSR